MDSIGLLTRLTLAVLATWRITHLLSSEDGPGDAIFHLRAKLGSSFAGKLMDCFYCLSLWVAAGAAIAVTQHLVDRALVWLALSGAACLLERATGERIVTRRLSEEGENSHGMLRSEKSEFEEQSGAGRAEQARPWLEAPAISSGERSRGATSLGPWR